MHRQTETSRDDQSDLKRFEILLTSVATRLMSIGAHDVPDVHDVKVETDAILDELLTFFAVEAVFLRRHDRTGGPGDLVACRTSDRTERPEGFPEESTGRATDSVATAPLRQGSTTVGLLGLVDRSGRRWEEDERRILSTVATLFAHLWGRLDAEERLAYQVHYDELTGLPNRRKLSEAIGALPDRRPASLLVIDIDNMKVINDGLDFETGNRFIEALANRVTTTVRPSGMVARLSGDQFAVLVVDTSTEQVERMANRLLAEMAETIHIDEEVGLARSVSIGVAHNTIAETNTELLAQADAALHQAKRDGKKRVVVFDEAMRAKVSDSFESEIELRRAVENDELTLHYQPEVDLETGEICAVEALVRWNHPHRGLLTAGAFIEVAEESGLVVDIGDQVLRQAIGQLARWQDDHPELEMWINISPAQLISRDVAGQIQQLLTEFKVRPQRICLEVTEHVVLGDIDATTGVLRRLRAMGIKLALDDFGTGYSSMKQLKQLPITALKIDMAFVAGLGISDHDSAIVDAAINLAAAFNLGTVAEGVETHQQIVELRKRGCQVAQGFLLSRPGPPAQIGRMLGRPLEIDSLA